MKIQCNVCESSEANVLCCADEAALCWACDQKVHTANKLASKHQRVPLSASSSHMPKCDICQERFGYFFCLEDRALLCRECDVVIHTANPLVSAHQRFLLTGVKVGLEAAEAGPSSSWGKVQSHDNDKVMEQENHFVPISTIGPSNEDNYETNKSIVSLTVQTSGNDELSKSNMPFSGGSAGGSSVPQWSQLDDLFGLDDFGHTYNYLNNASSKADNGKLGDSDSSPTLRTAVGEFDAQDSTGLIKDSFWAVPEIIPSPPTASGLKWPKNYSNLSSDSPVFVPDVSSPPSANHYNNHHTWSLSNTSKRRRQY